MNIYLISYRMQPSPHEFLQIRGLDHGPQRGGGGGVTTMTHAQMCDSDLRRCYCGAGLLEYRLFG